jgi:hypothetical protein
MIDVLFGCELYGQKEVADESMEPFNLNIFLLGCLGGLLPDILRFAKGRYEKAPEFYRYWNFWGALLLLVALGGLSAWLGGATQVKDALAFGFAAPEILSKIFSQHGSKPSAVDRGSGFSVLDWWRG